ncbi:hypothetical protein [Mycolicibacterium phlei]|jgi:hypothetical protein
MDRVWAAAESDIRVGEAILRQLQRLDPPAALWRGLSWMRR